MTFDVICSCWHFWQFYLNISKLGIFRNFLCAGCLYPPSAWRIKSAKTRCETLTPEYIPSFPYSRVGTHNRRPEHEGEGRNTKCNHPGPSEIYRRLHRPWFKPIPCMLRTRCRCAGLWNRCWKAHGPGPDPNQGRTWLGQGESAFIAFDSISMPSQAQSPGLRWMAPSVSVTAGNTTVFPCEWHLCWQTLRAVGWTFKRIFQLLRLNRNKISPSDGICTHLSLPCCRLGMNYREAPDFPNSRFAIGKSRFLYSVIVRGRNKWLK